MAFNLAKWFGGKPAPEPKFTRVRNVSRATEIGDRIEVADSAARRNKGLLGITGLG